MEIRNAAHPKDARLYSTERLRAEFLISNLFAEGTINMVYSHNDRLIIGGAHVTHTPLSLKADKNMGADYFLENREIGIINVGSKGTVIADGQSYILEKKEALYIGRGTKKVTFSSSDNANPALFYYNSAPAHKTYPTVAVTLEMAKKVNLGNAEESNIRTINQLIHPDVLQSCQLLMGLTELEPGNLWNTMHCHTHLRRMEAYFYFDLDDEAVVFHFMGEPNETRHLVVRNMEAIISPSWSIHSGVGTRSYSFIWGMAGENQIFTDMDTVGMKIIK